MARQIGEGYHQITVTDTSNCKLTYFDSIGNIGAYIDRNSPKAKEVFEEALKVSQVAVYLHTPQKSIADWILKNYEVFYCQEVYIGYDSSPVQYHILVKNRLGGRTEYIKIHEDRLAAKEENQVIEAPEAKKVKKVQKETYTLEEIETTCIKVLEKRYPFRRNICERLIKLLRDARE